jgi:hypothetical protein
MTNYRERLWAAPWIFISTALVMPAAILVFLPINIAAGIITAVVLEVAVLILIAVGSPTIEVTDKTLIAGRALLPLEFVGTIAAYRDDEATDQRGLLLDARAWLLIRGWISPVIRVEITDPDDPTPYWIVSSRTPEALVKAIDRARASV